MKVTALIVAFAVSALAAPAVSPAHEDNSLMARAASYKDGLKIICHSGSSSITCEGNRCTACCGDCCECIVFPFRKQGASKTLIEFAPNCSGKCGKPEPRPKPKPEPKPEPPKKKKKPTCPHKEHKCYEYEEPEEKPKYEPKPHHYYYEDDDDDAHKGKKPSYKPVYSSPHYHAPPQKDDWPFAEKAPKKPAQEDDDDDDEYEIRETRHPDYLGGGYGGR